MSFIIDRILALGADHAAEISGAEVPLDKSFRAACAQNACGYYGRCWTCPPDIGEIEQLMQKVCQYTRGVVFQTISTLEDSYDIEGMHDASVRHNRLVQQVRVLAEERYGKNVFILGAGACGVCTSCTRAENKPCRFPEKAVVSIEACGVDAWALAKKSGLKYINGANTVTYFGLLLYNDHMEYTLTLHVPHSDAQQIPARAEATIAHTLSKAGVQVELPCSGRGICGKCRVRAEGALASGDEMEQAALGPLITQGIRLACRAKITGDCTVYLGADEDMQIVGGRGVLRPVQPLFTRLGAAVDIGTTTLALQVYDENGFLAGAEGLNPQGAFGADVISRIGQSMEGKAAALKKAVADGIGHLLNQALTGTGRRAEELDALVITGNTAMLYLLTGRNPETLSHAPFDADCLFGETLHAGELGLPFSADCYLPRCMAAFVGADLTTAVLASGMLNKQCTALLMDVGTNGEIVLWHNGRLTCCSTAAGPAFEGALLRCGCRGISGAIDHVSVQDGKPACHTIGGGPAVGICGSGVVDAVAVLLELEWMDETGRLEAQYAGFGEEDAVCLTGKVCLTQKDIRAVQLAKGAIHAGLVTLLHEAGLEPAKVDAFYVAGGFGAFLDAENAGKIGLFPPALAKKATVLGNAALTGAAMLLCDKNLVPETEAFAARAYHEELSVNGFFKNQYMESMLFELP